MDLKVLEAQCMAIADRIDTEIVEGDPEELSTFAPSTLYLWMVPENSGGNDPERKTRGEPPRMMLRARYGNKLQNGRTVAEIAEKFGIVQRQSAVQPGR